MLKSQIKQFLTKLTEEINQSAENLVGEQMPAITEELFGIFEKTGNRLRHEKVYFTRRKFLAVLGMKAILEKQSGQYTDVIWKLAEVMQDICMEECWALPAHVDRARNPEWRITVDLFAAETAQTLAELTDRLAEVLPATVCKMVAENIERRVFQPFFKSEDLFRGWYNWNAVCNGAIGSACLHLMKKEPERLSGCLERICETLPYYLRSFAEDGTCMEGVGYYTYGMTYFTNFAQELYEYTEGRMDLFCGEWESAEAWKTGRIALFPAKCFFKDGISVSFSDSSHKETFRVGISSVLAMHYGHYGVNCRHMIEDEALFPCMDRAAGLHADTCYRFAALKMDLIYAEQYSRLLKEDPVSVKGVYDFFLPSAQWYIANSEVGVGFACKGGHNDEPHNHNDIGSFIYEANGTIFFTDLGAGEYTKKYFSEGRYSILCNSSFGHSVPIINGQGQCAGKQYSADKFEVLHDGGRSIVRMEAHLAYQKGLLERFCREFWFDHEAGKLQLQDVIVLSEHMSSSGKVTENLITQICPNVAGNQVRLESGSEKCIMTIEQSETVVSVVEYLHRNHHGISETVYAIQWEVPCIDGHAVCNISIG